MSEHENMRPHVVIIGKGPAGISAALYAARAGASTTVIAKGVGALGKADEIENYYGFATPIKASKLMQDGIDGAKRLGVNIIDDEVVHIVFDGMLCVQTATAQYRADAVVMATGASRKTPDIKGLASFEGKGVSYCAVCDGFFFREKDVAVLGSGEFALHEASELLSVVGKVTLLTNGEAALDDAPKGLHIDKRKIEAFVGENTLSAVQFEDGGRLDISGVFVALGVAGSTALARKLGAAVDGATVVVDANMATGAPGLYAAGDCTGGLMQVAKAVYEGAKAGMEAAKYAKNKHKK